MVPKKYADNFISYMTVLNIYIEGYRKGIINDKEYDSIEKEVAYRCGMPKRSVYRIKSNDLKWYIY